MSEIVLEINQKFEFPHMLASTAIEGAHQQKYFTEHLPELTDVTKEKNTISKFYSKLIFNLKKILKDTHKF